MEKLSRRRFLYLTAIIPPLLLDRGAPTPAVPNRGRLPVPQEYAATVFAPGAAEERITRPFFTLREGHTPFLRALCKLPEFNPALQESFRDIFIRPNEVIPLNEAYNCIFRHAGDALQDKFIHSPPSVLTDAAAVYATALAAMLYSNRWVSIEEVRQLLPDLNLPCNSLDDFYYGNRGIVNRMPAYGGRADGTWHVANHLFLTAYYAYLLKHNPAKAWDIPAALQFALSAYDDPRRRAEALSSLAGVGYEVKTSNPLRYLQRLINGQNIDQGIADPTFSTDMAGNDYGRSKGMGLAALLDNRHSEDDILSFFDGI